LSPNVIALATVYFLFFIKSQPNLNKNGDKSGKFLAVSHLIMDCRTLSKVPDDCKRFERHHKYLSGECVYSNENCEFKKGQKTGEDYEINFHPSFLTKMRYFIAVLQGSLI